MNQNINETKYQNDNSNLKINLFQDNNEAAGKLITII